MWLAVRQHFPSSTIRGCVFHWSQAIWRHVQEYGLVTSFRQRPAIRSYVSQLMALPFLPGTHIADSFGHLKELANTDELRQLTSYMERQWIHNSVFPPSSWSVYGLTVRTNNDVEGWHHRLNSRAGMTGLGFYRLVPLLKTEADLVRLSVLSEDLARDVRTTRNRMEEQIQEVWTAYSADEISSRTLLKRCSQIYRYHPE